MEHKSIEFRQEHVCICPVDVNLFQECYKIVIAILKGLLGKNLICFRDIAEVMLYKKMESSYLIIFICENTL